MHPISNITAYTLDKLNRQTKIEATAPNLPSPVLALNFRYDGEGNILQRNDNLYSYDALDRLQAAQVKGIFHEETGGQRSWSQKAKEWLGKAGEWLDEFRKSGQDENLIDELTAKWLNLPHVGKTLSFEQARSLCG